VSKAEPTIYVSLQDHGLKKPLDDWQTSMTEQIKKILDSLESVGQNQIRLAYEVGVNDGYRQALMDQEGSNG
jgi:hypothetical protein